MAKHLDVPQMSMQLIIIKLLWKEIINSDDQHFHQYLQYEQQPRTSNHWTYDIGNPDPGSGNEQRGGGVNGVATHTINNTVANQ